MSRSGWCCVGVILSCLLCVGVARAQDSTASLLTAKQVDDALIIRLLDEAAQKITKTSFEYRTLGESFKPLVSGRVFRASDAVRIEYEEPNPFDLQLSVSEAQADDPNAAQLAKFIEKLLTFPTVVGAAQGAQASECAALEEVYRRVRLLRTALRVGSTNATHLAAWRKEVEDAPGRAGILKARALIMTRIEALKTSREQAVEQLKYFEALVDSAKPSTAASAEPAPGRESAVFSGAAPRFRIMLAAQTTSRVPPTPGSGTPAPAQPKPVAGDPAKADNPKGADEPKPPACSSPIELARALATVIDIGNAREGLKNLDALIEAVSGIAKGLEPYATASRWSATRYLLYVVTPTPEKITTVTVTAAEIKYQVANGSLTQSTGATSSTKFDFREGSALVPELGAGMIVSSVLTPDYGTATNAKGEMVVAPAVKKKASYSGALVLNAVCRCGIRSSFAYPMLQFGASTDGTSPALLFGVGGRFTRPKRLALSAGVILAWIKDLDALSVGSVIKGTGDIKADLKFRNEVKPYFGFIYNF